MRVREGRGIEAKYFPLIISWPVNNSLSNADMKAFMEALGLGLRHLFRLG